MLINKRSSISIILIAGSIAAILLVAHFIKYIDNYLHSAVKNSKISQDTKLGSALMSEEMTDKPSMDVIKDIKARGGNLDQSIIEQSGKFLLIKALNSLKSRLAMGEYGSLELEIIKQYAPHNMTTFIDEFINKYPSESPSNSSIVKMLSDTLKEDQIIKPFNPNFFVHLVNKVVKIQNIEKENNTKLLLQSIEFLELNQLKDCLKTIDLISIKGDDLIQLQSILKTKYEIISIIDKLILELLEND